MLKILQTRLQQYVKCELPDEQAGFRKSRGTRDEVANIHWNIKKAREFQEKKTSISALLTRSKPLTLWITANCEKFFMRWEYQSILSASSKICIHVKKQALDLDMEQQTASKSGKVYIKAIYCHPAYLTYMPSTSCEMPGWMTHELELRLPGEISITSDTQMTSPLWQKVKNN